MASVELDPYMEAEAYRAAQAEVIFEFPRIDGNEQLDKIVRHANFYGRCLFTVAGSELMEYCPVEGEVEIGTQ